LILLLAIVFCNKAYASEEKSISTIRDEETERYIKEISKEVFDAIGLNSKAINIIIINNNDINAFVTGGQKIYIHTGLIKESDDPSVLMGVIAHESGHISGGHLTNFKKQMDQALISSSAGLILGLGSMLLGAPSDAGIGIIAGSQQVAQRNLLSYSRENESYADTVALNALKKIGISPKGLIALLEKLKSRYDDLAREKNEYVRTHPLSENRIAFLRSAIKDNPEIDKASPEDLVYRNSRVRAKVIAFLDDPDKALSMYKDDAEISLYARSIALHRKGRFNDALATLAKLIALKPEDPYYNELKGQILFENGKIEESIIAYKKALSLLPSSVLIRLKLGISQIETNDKADLKQAIETLKTILVLEPRNLTIIKKLAIAYGKMGNLGASNLYLGEEAIIKRKIEDAEVFLNRAEKANLKPGSFEEIRLNDLKIELKRIKKEDKKRF
jgi:predicted Zn-dependent protease